MLTIHLITSRKRSSTVLTSVSDHFPPYVQFLALPGGQSGLIWLKFLNLVNISEIWSKFSEVLILFCLKIFYLKIFHLKILHWIRRQCVDCRNRNVDSDSRLFKKSTVTVTCRLSTFIWPLIIYILIICVTSLILNQLTKFCWFTSMYIRARWEIQFQVYDPALV